MSDAKRIRRAVRLGWVVFVALATTWATVVGVLVANDVLKWTAWTAVAPLVVASLANAVQAYRAARGPLRERTEIELNGSLSQAVASGVIRIAKATGLPLEMIGACVWQVQDHRPILLRPRLVRLLRFRVNTYPVPSEIDWIKGKGMIGTCWETKTEKHVDWRPWATAYADGVTEQQWMQLAGSHIGGIPVQNGFTREEFVDIVGKYAEILAVPIRDSRGGVLGVLSIDLPVGVHTATKPCLSDSGVRSEAQAMSVLLANLMK